LKRLSVVSFRGSTTFMFKSTMFNSLGFFLAQEYLIKIQAK
jgi:hypothetical protein